MRNSILELNILLEKLGDIEKRMGYYVLGFNFFLFIYYYVLIILLPFFGFLDLYVVFGFAFLFVYDFRIFCKHNLFSGV